ncbi:lipopolysaccharide biosynthesis protein [Candidatus Woesebacteria bacterium]|nr:MAG: lipopolysaccharide biosynthesis protein [Candidatus Woesebacteria bacterium]
MDSLSYLPFVLKSSYVRLLRKTTIGITWTGGFRLSSRIVAYAKLAIIARILNPEQFGVYAIATLALAFLEIFTETGINTVLIQEKKNIDNYIDTAWIVSIFRGCIIGGLLLVMSYPLSIFFKSQESRGVLELIVLVPIIRGFINPAIVKLQKELLFKKEFVFRLSIFIFDALVGVWVTYLLKHPIGLIWGFIAGALLETLLSYLIIRPIPQFKLDTKYLKIILSRGKWITGSGISHYLFSQGDDVVVGKILGTTSLGIYQAAYRLSTLPVSEVADVIGKVTFPVFVKISHDKKKLKSAFLTTMFATGMGALVLGSIIYLFAQEIVMIVLGSGWMEVIPIVRILIVFGVIQALVASFNPLFLAVKKQNYVTGITTLGTILLACGIVPFINAYALMGTVYAVIFASILTLPLAVYYCAKILHDEPIGNHINQ